MRRRLCFSLIGLTVLGALGSLAGCGRSFLSFQERESWRHEAEVKCLKSGAVKEGAGLVRISPIDGPGICGADFPLKVAALGESSALGFADALRPPGSIPNAGNTQPRWPVSQQPSRPADVYAPSPIYREPVPPAYPAPRASDAYVPPPGSENYLRSPEQPRYAAPTAAPKVPSNVAPGEPLSLRPPGIADLIEADAMSSYPPGRPGSVVRSYPPDRPTAPRAYPAERPYYGAPQSSPAEPPSASSPRSGRWK
jgi:hypothetical protein